MKCTARPRYLPPAPELARKISQSQRLASSLAYHPESAAPRAHVPYQGLHGPTKLRVSPADSMRSTCPLRARGAASIRAGVWEPGQRHGEGGRAGGNWLIVATRSGETERSARRHQLIRSGRFLSRPRHARAPSSSCHLAHPASACGGVRRSGRRRVPAPRVSRLPRSDPAPARRCVRRS